MVENENQQMSESQPELQHQESKDAHPIATGLGAVGGGAIGAAVGRSINRDVGAVVGGVVGAIAGGMVGNAAAEITETVIEQVQPSGLGFGADHKPIELPQHYSWEELRSLSKPQGGQP